MKKHDAKEKMVRRRSNIVKYGALCLVLVMAAAAVVCLLPADHTNNVSVADGITDNYVVKCTDNGATYSYSQLAGNTPAIGAFYAINSGLNGLTGSNFIITVGQSDSSSSSFNLQAGKNVTLTSADPSNPVTINYIGAGRAGTLNSGGGSGTSANLTLENIILSGNGSNNGGIGVYFASKLTMNDGAIIENCYSAANGGGVTLNQAGSNLVMNDGSSILDCTAASGGGVYYTTGTFTMYGGTISGCSATGTTTTYGGGGIYAGGTLTMTGGEISGNNSTYGAGIYCNGATATITDVNILNNNASMNGGAIRISGNTNLTINGATHVYGNKADNAGGAIQSLSSTLIITGDAEIGGSGPGEGNTVVAPTPPSVGDAGGGIYVNGAGSTLTLSGNAKVQYNTSNGTSGGGGIALSTAPVIVTITGDASVNNNIATAGDGGGVIIDNIGASLTLSGNGSISDNSTTTGNGGGIAANVASGTISITGGTISGNTADVGDGGGIYSVFALSLSSATVSDNAADAGSGGGIWCNSTVDMSDMTLTDNTASVGGGAVYAADAVTTDSTTNITSDAALGSSGSGIWCMSTVDNSGTINVSGIGIYSAGGEKITNESGGLVQSNTSTGIYLYAGGDVLNEGTIQGSDYGVFVDSNSSNTVSLENKNVISGSVDLSNNTAANYVIFDLGSSIVGDFNIGSDTGSTLDFNGDISTSPSFTFSTVTGATTLNDATVTFDESGIPSMSPSYATIVLIDGSTGTNGTVTPTGDYAYTGNPSYTITTRAAPPGGSVQNQLIVVMGQTISIIISPDQCGSVNVVGSDGTDYGTLTESGFVSVPFSETSVTLTATDGMDSSSNVYTFVNFTTDDNGATVDPSFANPTTYDLVDGMTITATFEEQSVYVNQFNKVNVTFDPAGADGTVVVGTFGTLTTSGYVNVPIATMSVTLTGADGPTYMFVGFDSDTASSSTYSLSSDIDVAANFELATDFALDYYRVTVTFDPTTADGSVAAVDSDGNALGTLYASGFINVLQTETSVTLTGDDGPTYWFVGFDGFYVSSTTYDLSGDTAVIAHFMIESDFISEYNWIYIDIAGYGSVTVVGSGTTYGTLDVNGFVNLPISVTSVTLTATGGMDPSSTPYVFVYFDTYSSVLVNPSYANPTTYDVDNGTTITAFFIDQGTYDTDYNMVNIDITGTGSITVVGGDSGTTYGTLAVSGTINVPKAADSSIILSATPASGYNFKNFLIDDLSGSKPIRSSNNPTTQDISGDLNISVVFRINATVQFITAVADSGSTIDPSGVVSVQVGGSQTFTFQANAGYHIVSVVVDGIVNAQALIDGSYTFTNVTANHLIQVTSASGQAAITLTIDINPKNGGSAEYSFNGGQTFSPYTGTVTVPAGSNVVVKADPADGYSFEKWMNGSVVTTASELQLGTLSSSAYLTLYFSSNDGGHGSIWWWVIAAIILLILIGLLLWFLLFYRRYYDVIKPSGVNVIGDDRVHRKGEYTFTVASGFTGIVSYRVGEDGVWKILPPSASGEYVIPKGEIIDNVTIKLN